jgi:uncharacterized protein
MQEDADTEELHFYQFPDRAYLLGASKVILYISCEDSDDVDVFVQLRKVNKFGNPRHSNNVPLEDLQRLGMEKDQIPKTNPMIYLGPTGHLRASHRAFDAMLSKVHWPVHDHSFEEKIPPGERVMLEMENWPGGMTFEEGESALLKISGHWMTWPSILI